MTRSQNHLPDREGTPDSNEDSSQIAYVPVGTDGDRVTEGEWSGPSKRNSGWRQRGAAGVRIEESVAGAGVGSEVGPTRGEWRLRVAQSGAHLRADLSFALIDSLFIVMAYTTALGLRFFEDSSGVPERWFDGFIAVLPAILAIHLVANIIFGTYGHVWEYASVAEAVRIVAASVSAAVVILATVLISRQLDHPFGPIPVGVVALGSMLTLAGMGAVRFRSRMFSFKRSNRLLGADRTLVVGTGRAAAELARHLPGDGAIKVAGFVSTNGRQQRLLANLPVLGTIDEIDSLVRRHGIDQVIVAGAHDDSLLRSLVDGCLSVDVRLRILPDIDTTLMGDTPLRDVRDLELTDLLPRSEVSIDLEEVARLVAGRRVLVTGAGGSIGAEIMRQVLTFGPALAVALDHDETHLFDSSISWRGLPVSATPVLCDIRDRDSLLRQFHTYRPEVVFHAAAHKHVPILEHSVSEAARTNIFGTENVLDGSRQVGTERFVLISTDKAVRPASVMGASKRVAEMLIQAAAMANPRCRYSAVRFGNVLGSRGSVVPTFQKQIQQGGPLTITDPEMVRYFMTVGEAVQLVLQAAALTDKGETFVLDMGEPVRIMDLAHRLIRLAGLVPGRHIKVETIGARPGEKMAEILSEHELQPSPHPKIRIAEPSFPGPVTLMDALEHIRGSIAAGNDLEARSTLMSLARGTWNAPEVLSLQLFEDLVQWS